MAAARRRMSRAERKAAERARARQATGDLRPYMVILGEERRRNGMIIPLTRTRRCETIEPPDGLL